MLPSFMKNIFQRYFSDLVAIDKMQCRSMLGEELPMLCLLQEDTLKTLDLKSRRFLIGYKEGFFVLL